MTGDFISFLGEAVIGIGRVFVGRARLRRSDLMLAIEDCGPAALPIVALISFLVGLILAFVGAIQLQQFGASTARFEKAEPVGSKSTDAVTTAFDRSLDDVMRRVVDWTLQQGRVAAAARQPGLFDAAGRNTGAEETASHSFTRLQ
jgi:hypothetical protein